eukprot:TRINITY_DN21988_c0_g1_i1.p1 TRINITY_DN21988_c0_g1~~TRINITY_DN21988_c0_g1_i1.p1  ORF type:complete len:434 (-),score=93.03 TRINITY_DN21988_c0_g1_i1:27-1328(-)
MSETERATHTADGAIKRRARRICTVPPGRRTSRSPQSPRTSQSDFSPDVAIGMVRNLTLLRQTYSTAREVYAGLVARQADVEASKRSKRFFMAGYAVLIAVRTALQNKRYRLELVRQKAFIEEQFFQELRQTGADAAAVDELDSGIQGIFEILRHSSDQKIDERLETLVGEIMNNSNASFDRAYRLSQSLRRSLDELMLMRSQMDNLPVEAALAKMEAIVGSLSQLEITSRASSKEVRKPSEHMREEWQRASAKQEANSQEQNCRELDEGEICMARAETGNTARCRLHANERRLQLEERRSNLERVHADRKAAAWLQHVQEVMEATVTDKSPAESQAAQQHAVVDPGSQPSCLLQRRMSGGKNNPGGTGQELENAGWLKVAQEGILLPIVPSSTKADLEDPGPCTISDGTCSTKASADDMPDSVDSWCQCNLW